MPRTLSVTGGEPLVWPEFLLELAQLTPSRRRHLETAGGHPETLERVIEAFDHVSLDLKLPADMQPPVPVEMAHNGQAAEAPPADEAEWTRARRASLRLVAERDACAKVIVAGRRAAREFEPLLEDVARLAPRLVVYVQPVSPVNGVSAPSIEELVAVAELAREFDLNVRVVPQVHRLLRLP